MKFETQDHDKSEQEHYEQYYKEALVIAQRASHKWLKVRNNPLILDARLEEIRAMDRPPETGVQAWFNYQVDWLIRQAGTDTNAKSRMMYRVKEDLELIETLIDGYIEE